MSDPSEWTVVPQRDSMDGSEMFEGLEATVRDFWAFAMSDLRTNNVRGYLAEFLVREAVRASHPRVEWDAADVKAPDGTLIEVKSSGYLQVWQQRAPSVIKFGGLRGRVATETGWSAEPTYNADVYVFALQTATDHAEYDPLAVDQWRFWVLPASTLHGLGVSSISKGTLDRLTGSTSQVSPLPSSLRARGAAARSKISATW